MKRRAPAVGLLLGVAALLAAQGGRAQAGIHLRGLDASAFPVVRLTVVTPSPSARPPSLTEDGIAVTDLSTENLGRAKSLVLAIDRSRSMAGRSLANVVRAARAFVAAKRPHDRIGVVAFGRRPVSLTRFSSATIDADLALRTLAVDGRQGTALYDAVALAARSLRSEPYAGRVITVLTDGRDLSSGASLQQAVAAAQAAGAAVYPIGIEGPQFSREPLLRLARETGGAYHGVGSSAELARSYESIGGELRRSWRLQYVTAARPGEHPLLTVTVPRAGTAQASLAIPSSGGEALPTRASRFLPASILESPAGVFLLALAVAGLVLLACALVFAAPRGASLRKRLAPHVEAAKPGAKGAGAGERLAAVAGLFQATERALGHLRFWTRIERLLEQADLPLKAVEFFYLMAGSGLLLGLVFAVAGSPSPLIVAMLVAGACVPYLVVSIKSRRRMSAFETQLPDLLITLGASLKAGHSFKQGIQSVVEEGLEPASKELKRVLTETQLGRPMDEALAEMSERVGSKNFAFVITSVTIQRQVGGSLAGLFDMVAETVRQRQQFARKIKSLTAMGRMSAYVLIGLPFVLLFALTLLNSSYMNPLFHTSTGHKLMLTGLAMMAFGSLVLKKIVSFRG
jgi:tight adherence protein B